MIAKGAALGFKLALGYAVAFIVVGGMRYGSDLAAAPPDGDWWRTFAGGAISLAVASLGLAFIFGVVAALLGALTALAAVAIDHQFNAGHNTQRAAVIGIGVAAAVVLLLHGALWRAGLWSWSSLASTTYLFWLGAPALLYLAAAYRAGSTTKP
jgi:hypothetical protein